MLTIVSIVATVEHDTLDITTQSGNGNLSTNGNDDTKKLAGKSQYSQW